jgi:hypothetical protein
MPRGNDFSVIDPSETINGTWDFGPWLAAGVILTGIVATTCVPISGTDAGASARLIGPASIVASPSTGALSAAVRQRWGTMLASVIYIMTATVTTSDGQTLTLYAHEHCQGQT